MPFSDAFTDAYQAAIRPAGEAAGARAERVGEQIADAPGRVFKTPPGRTWVRVRLLASAAYAENESTLCQEELPVFANIPHARLPAGEALAVEVRAVTAALASCLAREPQRVHVQYAPALAGRQASGGQLVR